MRSIIKLLSIAQPLPPDMPGRKLLHFVLPLQLFQCTEDWEVFILTFFASKEALIQMFQSHPTDNMGGKNEKVSFHISELILILKICKVRGPCCAIMTSEDCIWYMTKNKFSEIHCSLSPFLHT